MKILRWITLILFITMLCVFIGFTIYEKKTADTSYPLVQLPAEPLEISIAATEEDLLRGVTAYDDKDGDLTDKLIIESLSQFIEEGVCTVTYAVVDGDCHVTKATRMIRYTDYTSPKFYLRRALVFAVGAKADFRNIVGAIDCIDGDISNRVSVIATDYTYTSVGVYTLTVQVTSSRGDIVYLDLPVYVEKDTNLAPTITLKESILYIRKGENPDFKSYVTGVYQQDEPMEEYQLLLSTDFNGDVPGVYVVHYYVENENGYEGHTFLTVIVEE